MNTAEINDPITLQAVTALDAGRLDELKDIINQCSGVLNTRLSTPGESGYFKDPYFIWFIADNPIRNSTLPPNIIEITFFLINAVNRHAPDTYDEQINYALELVATGRTPRECGVQIAMMDVLMDAGAQLTRAIAAISNGNIEAASHLIDKGAKLDLTTALILDHPEAIKQLINGANSAEKLTALTAAAFYGMTDKVKYMLEMGADPNGYPAKDSGFHAHATPLHQAVSAVSFDSVKLLVEAGARLDLRDKRHNGTSTEWADYLRREASRETEKELLAQIENYLKGAQGIGG